MRETFLRWIYKRNPKFFQDCMVEDFYGFIPGDVKEPALDFLVGSRHQMEQFFTIQAYNIQKRAIQDTKHSEFFNGMLAHIRSLLIVVQKQREVKTPVDIPKAPEDPVKSVDAFLAAYKATKK